MKLKLRRVLCSKDVVLELPVAIFHTATLPPPPPEPYPYPTPGAYSTMDPIPLVLSAALLLHSPMPILYPEPTQSPIYTYHSPALPLPSSPAPGQLVIPSYTPHNGQLWFPPPQLPTYINGDPLYYQPPLRPANPNPNPNLNNFNNLEPTTMISSGLPVSGTPDHVLSSFSRISNSNSRR